MRKISVAMVAIVGCCMLALCLAGCGAQKESTSIKITPEEQTETEHVAVEGDFSSGIHHARITVQGYGDIDIELNADAAPITVENFCKLANQGFYDGLTFHRIVKNFCLQGGDPSANGTGSSDEAIKGEFSANGVQNALADDYKRGTVAMARGSQPDSASCQFFITLSDAAGANGLNGNYAAFGTIDDAGMAVVDRIVADYASKATGSSGTISKKDDQPVITCIQVLD